MPMTDEQIDDNGTWHDPAARVQYVELQKAIDELVAGFKTERATRAAAAAKNEAKPEAPFDIANASRTMQDSVRMLANRAFDIKMRGWKKNE